MVFLQDPSLDYGADLFRSSNDTTFPDRNSTLRSSTSMKGLQGAEIGDGMVELDPCGADSGFRQGQRIVMDMMSPYTDIPTGVSQEQVSLSRHGTLLSSGATPARQAAELKSILGNANSRLKPGARTSPSKQSHEDPDSRTSFEQAKPRARVEVDICLESPVGVQGGYLNGNIKIRIRKRSEKEPPVMVSGGKIRVIGFECIQNDQRHTFYQCSSALVDATTSTHSLYTSAQDEEGFAEAREGVHILPFAMVIPLDSAAGTPKGTLGSHLQAGVNIRYIAMFSLKVKETVSGKRSIAHFYRDCEIWPRLNPSTILAPLPRSLQATATKGLFMGGNGKVTLSASLHRLYWVAGQQCYIKIQIINSTKRTIRSLTLSLLRSTTLFKPHPHLDVESASELDPDACQTSTSVKLVASDTLEMGQRGARGHASAKGWWTGVHAGETSNCAHFILLPADCLTVPRTRLLELQYIIRATASAGPLTSDVHVELPVKVVNFLSVDPPPSHPLPGILPMEEYELGDEGAHVPHFSLPPRVDPGFYNTQSSRHSGQVLESLSEGEDESSEDGFRDEDITQVYSSVGVENPGLGNLSLRDTDDIVQHVVTSASIDAKYTQYSSRFSDLYYTSVQESLDAIGALNEGGHVPPTLSGPHDTPRMDDCTTSSFPSSPMKASSFSQRVQDKMQAANQTGSLRTCLPVLTESPTDFRGPPLAHSEPINGQDDQASLPAHGSYFRARHNIPEEVESVDTLPQTCTTEASKSFSSFSSSEVHSQLGFAAMTDPRSNATSRHTSFDDKDAGLEVILSKLPRLPSQPLLDPRPPLNATKPIDEGEESWAVYSPFQPQAPESVRRARAQSLVAPIPTNPVTARHARSSSVTEAVKPPPETRPLVVVGGSAAPMSSVKARIRQLEQRMIAESGASGPL